MKATTTIAAVLVGFGLHYVPGGKGKVVDLICQFISGWS